MEEIEVFYAPTVEQQRYAAALFDPSIPAAELMVVLGLSPATVAGWFSNDRFADWLNGELERQAALLVPQAWAEILRMGLDKGTDSGTRIRALMQFVDRFDGGVEKKMARKSYAKKAGADLAALREGILKAQGYGQVPQGMLKDLRQK